MGICKFCMHRCDKCGVCSELKIFTSDRKKKCRSFLRAVEYACKNCAHIRYAYLTHQPYCVERGIYLNEQAVPCNKFEVKK